MVLIEFSSHAGRSGDRRGRPRFSSGSAWGRHNELLSHLEAVIEVGLRVRDRLVHSNEGWPNSIPDHQAVLDALRAGDAEGSAAAVLRLLTKSSEDLAEKMRKRRVRSNGKKRAASNGTPLHGRRDHKMG
jgi:hypothetical protein